MTICDSYLIKISIEIFVHTENCVSRLENCAHGWKTAHAWKTVPTVTSYYVNIELHTLTEVRVGDES